MHVIKFVLLVFLFFFLAGCSRKSVAYLKRKGVNVTERAISVSAESKSGNSIQIQYLGCGGLFIRHLGLAIMIDPFFSHQRFLAIGKSIFLGGKIRSKPAQIAFGKKALRDSLHISDSIIKKETKAIFAAHGHYDHLMDVPFIQQHWLGQQADIYVNNSSFNTCSNVINRAKLHDVESLVSVRNQQGNSIDLPASDGSVMRIYPILAAHNPHSRNIKLFSGSVMKPVPYFTDPQSKTNVNDWLEGRTLSFLIDIEKNDKVVFRMFVQSSSCHFPDGLPPEDLLLKRQVDVAVLGIASYHFSEKSYPCEYLQHLQPRNLMFIHWEDFFRKYQRKPKTVLKNNILRFFQEVLPQCKPAEYILPVPGIVINFYY